MLDFIRAAPLIALVLTLVGSIGVSAPAGWFARQFIAHTIEIPAAVTAERLLCAAETAAAAARATQRERDRQYQVGEAIWRETARRQAEDEAEHEAQLALIREEAMDYVGIREAEGRACRLTQRDVDHLVRVPDHGNPPPGGR